MQSKKEETVKKSASRNIRFIQSATSVVQSTRLKPYSSKYSKKTYTQTQLLVLILFKDFRNQHYREFIDDMRDMEHVREILNLSTIPHFTTLQKFLCRIKFLMQLKEITGKIIFCNLYRFLQFVFVKVFYRA